MMAAHDAAGRQKYAGIVLEQSAVADKSLSGISKEELNAEGRVIFGKMLTSWNTYKGFRDKALPLALAMDDAGALKILDVDARASLTETRKYLKELTASLLVNAENLDRDTDGNLRSSALQLITMIVLGAMLAVGAGVFISRLITKPLAQCVAMMDELSKAHLDTRLHLNRNDEIGVLTHSMDGFADVLQGVVKNLHTIADGQWRHASSYDERISGRL